MLIRVIAVLAAFLICSLFAYIFAGVTPDKMISAMIDGNFGTERRMWQMAKELSILLGIAIALTPAFLMRFWNIGGEGQIMAGALASVICIVNFGGKIAEPLLLLMMFLSALLAGALWGFIPSFFKAIWNSNETLFTLMMNYIAIQLVKYMIAVWEPKDNTLGELNFGHLNFFPEFQNYGDELTVVLIALILTIFMHIYLRYGKQGYEISVVGESENTARYIGINVKKVTMRTMALSGMLCGLVGFLIVSVFDHSITAETAGGNGFTAIMVSWLAKFNPIVMIGTAFIITFLDLGAAQLVSDLSSVRVDNFLTQSMGSSAPSGIGSDFPSIIVGIILFFIVGCEFFINYKIKFRKFSKKEGKK
ncbi:MAG: ABC transporter permease [Clostridia bacterium]|nr:ABC transporter permease [Clostridia bacterium]